MILAIRRVSGSVGALVRKVWAARAEHLQALAVLLGWGLLWWGLSDVLARWLSPRGIQAVGLGLLVLSCVGWKVLRILATIGLYGLSKADKT